MGCFDAVKVRCPNCNSPLELQSKSGGCMMETYNIHNAPLGVMQGVVGLNTCSDCNKQFFIEQVGRPTYIVREYDSELENDCE